ncbi:MAG: hypothetical protein V3S41_05725 [Spirochaetia bacterium]
MKHNKVPEILIEQYALGELSPERVREIERSPGFNERIAEINRSNAEILAQYPPEQFVARIRNQFNAEQSREADRTTPKARRRPVARWLAVALPGAAVVVVGVFMAVQGFFGAGLGGNPSEIDDVVRIKGSLPELSVYRSVEGPDTRDNEAEELLDGALAHAGDRLQLSYNAGDRGYGAIVSVDGRGGVYTHFPLEISSEPRLEVGRDRRLAYGYQLDDAPRFEHFYFIISRETFSVQKLIQTIRSQADRITERADSLELGDEFEIISITIRKGE